MEKFNGKVQGHGYFRKTKAYGLASGIALGLALLVGTGVASADEVTPTNTPSTSATTNLSDGATATQADQADKATVTQADKATATQTEELSFENRQETTKIVNNQTPSNTVDSNGTYNSQIKSIETIPATTNDAVRYRVELHDGYSTGKGGKLEFYTNNSEHNPVSEDIKDGETVVGRVFVNPLISLNSDPKRQEIKKKLNEAKTFEEFSNTVKNTKNHDLTGLSKVTLVLNEKFASKNKNRAIEFELINPYGTNPRSLSTLLGNDFKALYTLEENKKAATEKLKDTFKPEEFSGPKTVAGVNGREEKGALILPSVKDKSVAAPTNIVGVFSGVKNETSPQKLTVLALTSSVPKTPTNMPKFKGVADLTINTPVTITSLGDTYKPHTSGNGALGENEDGKKFIQKGDKVNYSLSKDTILRFSSNLKVGDEIDLTLETEKRKEDVGGSRFTDTNLFVKTSSESTSIPDSSVKFKVEEVSDTSITVSALEDVTVKSGYSYELDTKNLVKAFNYSFTDNWLSTPYGEKVLSYTKDKKQNSREFLDTKPYPEIKSVINYIRDNKVITSNKGYATILRDANTVYGENATGTVKVRYVDEDNKEIPGQKVETIAENQSWDKIVTITPKQIDGYSYVKSSAPLKTLVGEGEQIITLTYKLNELPKEDVPITEETITNYIPDPNLDPGKQEVDKPGKPKKTQGDKVVDPGDPKVVRVGTKPKVTEEDVPFNKVTRDNPQLPEGETKVVQVGKVGKKKTTTTYTVDPKTGKVTPNEPTVETTPPVDEITEVGKGKDKEGDLKITYIPDPESPEGTETIVDQGKKPKYDVTGKEKDPGKPKVVKVGTKPKVTEEDVPFNKVTRDNPELPEGETKVVQVGKNGKKKTTITYTLDPKTGKVTPNEPTVETTPPVDEITEVGKGKDKEGDLKITYIPDPESPEGTETIVDQGKKPKYDVTGKEKDPGKPKVVKVGTKPKVTEEEIPYKEVVVENPSKPEGYRQVLKKGKVGKKTTTVTYTLDPKTGKVTPNEPTVTIVKAEDELIEVGTGQNITGEIVTQYVPDIELEFGKTKIVQKGTPEVKDVTGKIVTPGTPTIIHIGTKPKVDEEDIEFKVVKRDNPELPKGKEKVVQEGKVGKKKTTTTYEVDPKTGKVTSNTTEEVDKPTDKIIEVGTKEEAKVTPAPQTPKTPTQTPAPKEAPKAQLPNTGEKASSALALAGVAMAALALAGIAKTKKEEK